MQKRIPTILGLVVLVVAMVAGVLLFGQGTGVFAPRATPQTTPKKIKITNITDTSFTVSFITDQSITAFLKYGTAAGSTNNQAGDDRDQISGSVQPYNTHHLTVRGLQPNTTYYFILGTGSGTTFTNEGDPFTVKTAAQAGTQPAAKTIYGSATTESGTPADGAIVYVKHSDASELSSLVKSSGSWAIPLSNARTVDGTTYATIGETDPLIVQVQGPQVAQVGQLTTTVSEAQPVETIAYGQAGATGTATIPEETELIATEEPGEATPAAQTTPPAMSEPEIEEEQPTEPATMAEAELESATPSATSATPESQSETPEVVVLDIEQAKAETVTVTTTQPKIVGKAKPNVTIKIEVHSDTQISEFIVANADGTFELDIAALSQTLEPGEHTVTYSYTDPDTGEEISETVTFTVANTSTQIAQANQPFGSGNPFPMPNPSPSPSPTPSPSPSPSPTASASASPSPSASASAEATDSARAALPATDSAIPVSGSIGTTLALVFGGLFFIISGVWSFWISSQLQRGKLEL